MGEITPENEGNVGFHGCCFLSFLPFRCFTVAQVTIYWIWPFGHVPCAKLVREPELNLHFPWTGIFQTS